MTTAFALGLAAAVLVIAVPIVYVSLKRRHTIMTFHEQE